MRISDLKGLNLTDAPGVYVFHGAGRKILYIGKATSLRNRVRSYFSSNLVTTRSEAVVAMVNEAKTITWQETGSVLEALILEANLIKKFQPPYNARDKDNKSFNYLVITKEDYPCLLVVRGRELFQRWKNSQMKHLFGPFPQGGSLKEAVRIVRRIFPFRDKCIPNSGRPCFNRQIGLCPGVCSGGVSKTEYARTVGNITKLFSGNFQGLKRDLLKDMKEEAKSERYEKAEELHRQISALSHIRDVSLIKDESRISFGGPIASSLSYPRIEAYDVAHTGGTETVGVMTVVENGEEISNAYRKFIIKSAKNNDVDALKKVLSRRLVHNEWQLPRVIVVDGGIAQLKVAERVLKDAGVFIPIVGVVKNKRHKPERLIGDTNSIKTHENSILLANSEAHRFALKFHRARRDAGVAHLRKTATGD